MYLSFVIGQTIKDSNNTDFGKLDDLIVSPSESLPYVTGVMVNIGYNRKICLDMNCVKYNSETEKFTLNTTSGNRIEYQIKPDDFYLKKDILDKQIVDIHNFRVIRVNDVRLESSVKKLFLVGVDTGTRGLLRRMGLMHAVDFLTVYFKNLRPASQIIAWNDVETIEIKEGKIKLKVEGNKLLKLHPSDIAKIINDLDPSQRKGIIENLGVEKAADVLADVEPEIQASIVENLSSNYAADVLEEMEPDEAADILGDISEETRDSLLEEMEPDEAEDVIELLAYEDNTAGGLMTNDYISFPKGTKSKEVIDYIIGSNPEDELCFYTYITDANNHVLGYVTIKDVIQSDKDTCLEDIMNINKLISVNINDDVNKLAEIMKDYNLVCVPVVNDEDELQGVITVDDVLECLVK